MTLAIKDGAGADRSLKTTVVSTEHIQHSIPTDPSGNPYTTGNPNPTADAGFGTDGSSPPTLPGGATGVRGWLRYLGSLFGATNDADATGDGSVIAILKRLRTLLSNVIVVGGTTATPTSTFTRPANSTAYASGDIITDSTTTSFSGGVPSFTAARVVSGSFMIRRIRLRKSDAGITNAQFRVHLFSAAPTSLAVDNAAFAAAGVADYLGSFDVTIDRPFTSGAFGAGVPVVGSDVIAKLSSGQSVFWLLEARAAYTPVSGETFTLQPEIVQD
jgi:hypothetical protein